MTTFAKTRLRKTVVCPHCWNELPPEDALWISEHPDLLDDIRLGPDFAKRFLPSRFTAEGDAIDELGTRCSRLSCNRCHLEIPRALFQIPETFFSILGAPACGKSYFLASMSWKMRQFLPSKMLLSMNDTDTVANARLHEYEEQQFLNANVDELVALEKTQAQGDLYDQVDMGDHSVTLPRPFMFTIQPMKGHPQYDTNSTSARILCLYDNAGESFLPGADTTINPVTRHLAMSRCLFFCFDPTQDPRFRAACRGKTDDPQMLDRKQRLEREANVRQDTILSEAIHRVRRHAGLRDDRQDGRPLTIVVTKWDSWKALLPQLSYDPPYVQTKDGPYLLDGNRIQATSNAVEALLRDMTPEIVAAAEGFSENVLFVPVSAIGRAPEFDERTQGFGIRPKDIHPHWVEVPLLSALSTWTKGLVGTYDREQGAE